MIAVLIINHGTVAATRACVVGVLAEGIADLRIHLLDNGSGAEQVAALAELARVHHPHIAFEACAENVGFAAGMNRLLRAALADPAVDQLLFLNSDALPTRGAVAALRARIDLASRADMVAANMRRTQDGAPTVSA